MGEAARHINTVPEKFNVISDNVIGGNHQVELQDLGLQPATVQTEDRDHNTIASFMTYKKMAGECMRPGTIGRQSAHNPMKICIVEGTHMNCTAHMLTS